MNWLQRIDDASSAVIAWAVAAGLGAFVWMLRKIFTNEAEINLLKADLERRTRQRDEDRMALVELKDTVHRIEVVLMRRDGK